MCTFIGLEKSLLYVSLPKNLKDRVLKIYLICINRYGTMHKHLFFFIILSLFLACSQKSNPFLDYEVGDYLFSLSPLPDTLYTLVDYSVSWHDLGEDRHWSFRAITEVPGVLDTANFHHPDTTLADSLLNFYFLRGYHDTLRIEGIRWNLKPSCDTAFIINVVERFSLRVDSTTLGSGLDVEFSIVNSHEQPLDSLLSALWYVNGEMSDSLPLDVVFTRKAALSEDFTVAAVIVDHRGNHNVLDTLRLQIRPAGTPRVSIEQKSISVPFDKLFTLTTVTANADSLRWQSSFLHLDTTVAGPQITLSWTETDTVIVTALNRLGVTGNSDTVIIIPKAFNYDLTEISFPSQVQARKWTTWEVEATRGAMPVGEGNAVYHWTVSGDTAGDTVSASGGRLEMCIMEEKQLTVSVFAIVGIDSSWSLSRTVEVIAKRPSLSVSQTGLTTPVNTQKSVVVKATEGDSSSPVTGIWYKSEGDSVNQELTGDTLRLTFTTPGDKITRVWAVDTLGQSSDTTVIVVHVTAAKPYFRREIIDTAVYIHDEVRIDGKALSGNSGDSVITWKWDFDNDGTWDRTTKTGYYDTTYTSAGKRVVRIWCANSAGDSSEVIAVRNIEVSAGIPVIDSAVFSSEVVYINKKVELRIYAHDINGVVKKLNLRWGEKDSLAVGTNSRSVDTTLKLFFADAGIYGFTITATDEDGQKSKVFALPESLTVDQGTPRVKGISPDTVWFNTDTVFVISAQDNESVAGYAVSFDNSTFSSWDEDSAFRHTFADSGKQYLFLKVRDDEENVSAVFKDSVFVKAGYPGIKGISMSVKDDSVYVLDTLEFTITASDPDKRVRMVYVNWEGGSVALDSLSVNGAEVSVEFEHVFAVEDSGSVSVKVWCRDDDGMVSGVATKNVYVKVGVPGFSSIVLGVDPREVFVKDNISFRVKGTDENGRIDSVLVSWDGDSAFEKGVKAGGDSAVFNYTFPRAQVERILSFCG